MVHQENEKPTAIALLAGKESTHDSPSHELIAACSFVKSSSLKTVCSNLIVLKLLTKLSTLFIPSDISRVYLLSKSSCWSQNNSWSSCLAFCAESSNLSFSELNVKNPQNEPWRTRNLWASRLANLALEMIPIKENTDMSLGLNFC